MENERSQGRHRGCEWHRDRKKRYDTDSDSGKVQALKEASKTLAGISNAIERDVYISRISSKEIRLIFAITLETFFALA